MTEVERLEQRYKDTGVVEVHHSWGPDGVNLTDEERAAVVNKMLDQHEENEKHKVEITVFDLTQIVDSLQKLSRLGQSTVDEWIAMSESERVLRRSINEAIGMSLALAKQRLST